MSDAAFALCPEHKLEAALGTCERCGTFLCEKCLAPMGPGLPRQCTGCATREQPLPSFDGVMLLLAIRFAAAPVFHGLVTFGATDIAATDHTVGRSVFIYLAATSSLLIASSSFTAALFWRRRKSAVTMAIVHQVASSLAWLGFSVQAVTDGHTDDRNFGIVIAVIAALTATMTIVYLRSSERVKRTLVR